MLKRTISLFTLSLLFAAFCYAQSAQTTTVTNNKQPQKTTETYEWHATMKLADPSKSVPTATGAASKPAANQHPAVKKLQQHQNNKGNNKQK